MREQNISKEDDTNIAFDNIYHDIKQESVDDLLYAKSHNWCDIIYNWIARLFKR